MNRTAKNRSFAKAAAAAGVLTLALSGAAAWAQPALEPQSNPAPDSIVAPAAQTETPALLLPGQPPPPGVPVATPNPAAHTATLHFAVSIPGTYTVADSFGVVATVNLTAGTPTIVALPLGAGVGQKTCTITR